MDAVSCNTDDWSSGESPGKRYLIHENVATQQQKQNIPREMSVDECSGSPMKHAKI